MRVCFSLVRRKRCSGTKGGGFARKFASGCVFLAVEGSVACGGMVREPGSELVDAATDTVVADASVEERESDGDDTKPGPPSCAPGGLGMTQCGANQDSCCASQEVVGGQYYRTYSNDGGGAAGETDFATVSSFRLDKYDVTVGRFRQFVKAWNEGWLPNAGSGKHTHLNGSQGLVDVSASAEAGVVYEPGWLASDDTYIAPTDSNLGCPSPAGTWTNVVGTQENLPINCINWQEGFAFCIWDGGFLPSEAEWEYAAAGGSQQREYPWGSTDPGTMNLYAIYDCDYPSGSGLCGPPGSVSSIAPVGTTRLGAGRWGQFDLAGDVEQWTLDGYAKYVNPCVDCAYAAQACGRVFRGGHGNVDRSGLLPSERGFFSSLGSNGVRCARLP
jgi:sulfatase modifying factor 1